MGPRAVQSSQRLTEASRQASLPSAHGEVVSPYKNWSWPEGQKGKFAQLPFFMLRLLYRLRFSVSSIFNCVPIAPFYIGLYVYLGVAQLH